MDLFSMGVIDDPDRPKQHRPAPVRCLERELAPLTIRLKAVCERCCLSPPKAGKTLCDVCQRAVACHERGKRRDADRRAENKVLARAAKVGWIVPGYHDRHIVERMVENGTLRWLRPTERRRYGLDRFDDVAVVVQP